MSKTNQTLRDVFHKNGLNYSQIVGEENTVVSMGLEGFNQALKEISELLLDCKPKDKAFITDFNEGWEAGIDDYEKNIKARLQ